MKELLILSGKGGTGKTTIASAFIELGRIKAYADCDVDAPNLNLLLNQEVVPERSNYYGMDKAKIDQDLCASCGICKKYCAFDAIDERDGNYKINNFACEGCSVCESICPEHAIKMKANVSGQLELFKSDKTFSTASLTIGEGNSGLLVTEVKEQLRDNLTSPDIDISIIDGSPGIGCPVIASINDADMVLVVAEPSLSGLSDLKRIVETAKGFDKKIAICINKYDINQENTKKIYDYAISEGIKVIGRVPYDEEIVKNLNAGKTAARGDSKGMKVIEDVFRKTMDMLLN